MEAPDSPAAKCGGVCSKGARAAIAPGKRGSAIAVPGAGRQHGRGRARRRRRNAAPHWRAKGSGTGKAGATESGCGTGSGQRKRPLRRPRGSSVEIVFRSFLRPAGLLREVCAQPSIAKTAVLLAGVPARIGACLGAGAALEGEADRVKKSRKHRPLRRRVEAAAGLTTSAPRSSRHIDGRGGAG